MNIKMRHLRGLRDRPTLGGAAAAHSGIRSRAGSGRTVRNREEFGAGATAGRVRCACGAAASQLRFFIRNAQGRH